MRIITFDIETTGEAPGGVFDISKQELTVVGVHDSLSGAYTSYLQDELPKMWPLFEAADALVGYNSDHFDIPVLNRYYAGDLTKIKSIDLLKEVKNVLGRRLKLESLAQATLGRGKSGDGMEATRWWREGKTDKVREYCIDDVRITRELYDYARTHGGLKFKDYEGVRDIKLDTREWEKPAPSREAITHTLPF